MLKIWGRPKAINVQKAMWTIGELGIDHEQTNAGGQFGLNDQDWYLAMNPNGRVPVIDDDGFVLYESNTIVRYLAAKHGRGSLQPVGLQNNAIANQWMDWQQTTLSPAMFAAYWGLVRTARAERDYAAIAKSSEDCGRLFKQLDTYLQGRDYVVGEHLTMADIPVGAAAYRWFGLDIERPEVANVSAWYDRLTARPAYRKHVMLPIN